jgi:hypothetical protein
MDRLSEVLVFPGGAWDGETNYEGISAVMPAAEVEKAAVVGQEVLGRRIKRKAAPDKVDLLKIELTEGDTNALFEVPSEISKPLYSLREVITSKIVDYTKFSNTVNGYPDTSEVKKAALEHLSQMFDLIYGMKLDFKSRLEEIKSELCM